MSGLTLWLLLTLAAYRMTRLVTTDVLLEKPREWYAARVGPSSLRGYFITCDFCAGWWVSGAIVGAYWLVMGLPAPLLWWPAVAAGVGLTADVAERIEGS